MCGGNAESMERHWLSVIQHVCNDHSACQHRPLAMSGREALPWLEAGSTAHTALAEFVQRFTRHFEYYVKARSTASLESFHNVILKYATKRIAYRTGHTMRISLAILDWNHQHDRDTRYTARKYSKRSKHMVSQRILETKDYNYLNDILRLYFDYQARHPLSQFRQLNRADFDSSPPHSPLGND